MGLVETFLAKIDPGWLYLAMHLVKGLIYILDMLLDPLFGYSIVNGSKEERLQALRENRTAHVVKVHFQAWMNIGVPSDLSNFLYTHVKYEHPDVILNDKNIIIYSFDETTASFTVNAPEVDLFEIKRFPFTFIGQFYMAQKLIIIPHATLHRLAEKIGDPKVNVTAVNMTARCGSTLLTQMISRLPNTRAMGEPWALIHLNRLFTIGKISKDDMKSLTLSGLRLLCKVEPSCQHLQRIFIKFTCMNAPQFETFREVMPQMKLIFNTRQLVPSLKSLKKITANIAKDTIGDRGGFQWRWGAQFHLVPFGDPMRDQMFQQFNTWFQHVNDEVMFAFMTAGVDYCFLARKDIYEMVVLYEDLHSDPKKVLQELFKIIEAPEDQLDLALEALEHDSQNNILAPRGEAKTGQLSRDKYKEIDQVFKDLGVPLYCDMSFEEFKRIMSLSN